MPTVTALRRWRGRSSESGIDGFCVALARRSGRASRGGHPRAHSRHGRLLRQAWGEVLARGITPVIYDVAQAEGIAREVRLASSKAAPVGVHFKIDTGMGRLGCELGELERSSSAIRQIPEIRVEGSHDAPGLRRRRKHRRGAPSSSSASTKPRIWRTKVGISPDVRHAANSAALFRCRESRLDWVRPGIALFGVAPRFGDPVDLRPAMTHPNRGRRRSRDEKRRSPRLRLDVARQAREPDCHHPHGLRRRAFASSLQQRRGAQSPANARPSSARCRWISR